MKHFSIQRIANGMLLFFFLYNSVTAQSLKSIVPNHAFPGDTLTVTISGSNTNFFLFIPGSPTVTSITQVYLRQVSGSYLNSASFKAINDSIVTAKFNIPIAVSLGYYDIHVNTSNHGDLVFTGGFLIILNGVDENTNDRFLKIYPNPAKENVYMQFQNTNVANWENAEIVIYDVQGKILFHTNQNISNKPVKINVRDYVPGIYFLHLKTKEQSIIKKFIIE